MNELILVVDDEPKIVKLARDYLEKGGFRVVSAGDGGTAVAIARRDKPDLIVLDLNLPGMDGLDVCRALGATRYVTGHGAASYLDHAAFDAAGIEVRYMDYALKPYPQMHGTFTPYVTILDAIACCGSGARQLMASGTVNWSEHVDRSR